MKDELHVALRDVTGDNFAAVINLQLPEDQQDMLASNAYSIAESKFDPYARPRAIYNGTELVGFLMYWSMDDDEAGADKRPNEYSICRFMVDHRHQGKGVGRRALQLALEEIRQNQALECIYICYHPSNPIAKDFYASFGFVETGMDEDHEMIAEIRTARAGR
ncbi:MULTISPECIES: GNAT family N-acetyltransferase [unclassified Janthinobacterium]|uniref:GNAT family N-acetyltransferase n=1 Tax=unclassified Janthinobacterium TaxID=2610881 RepID=UPI00034BEE61|nr:MULTISPECIES: GNAT family N-acetyltransferase [unclassified Janthinobacterium]MEC5159853.1 diamine N-acetyltransferase [Janthinobacterium sp. CG_S6]